MACVERKLSEPPRRIDPGRHRFNPFGVEDQPIQKGRRHAGGFGRGHILGIGRKDCRAGAANRRRHGGQRAVFARRSSERQRVRGAACSAPDLVHRRFKTAGT